MASREVQKVSIEIEGSLATITEFHKTTQTVKNVNPDDLRYIFSDTSFETGLIPGGTLSCLWFGQRGDKQGFICESAPRKSDLYFGRRSNDRTFVEQVPFPHLLFAFCLNPVPSTGEATGNRLRGMKVFGLHRSVRGERDTVFSFNRYGNVYDNGNVCWGDNVIDIRNLWSVRGAINAFYTTPFNEDLGGSLPFVQQCATAGEYQHDPDYNLSKTILDVINETVRGENY